MELRRIRGADGRPRSISSGPIGSCSATACPGGESVAQVGDRADRLVDRIRAIPGDTLLFSSGHFLRVFTARWLRLDAGCAGRYFLLSTASLSAVSYEHNLSQPVIRLWNDDHHVVAE